LLSRKGEEQMTRTGIKLTYLKYKSVALPASHGGWGFLLEPVLLGLLVAPSAAGWWLGVAALGVFLLQQPLKLLLSDAFRQRWYPRSTAAARFTSLYGLLTATGLALTTLTSQHFFWLPLLLAIPLALIQLYYDIQNRGRELAPEISGAIALGATAPAIAIAGGWLAGLALGLWLVLLVRAWASVVYVRAKLRFERGQAVAKWPVWLVHLVGLVTLGSAAYFEWVPWLAVAALAVLGGRAVIGLLPHERPVKARTVGFQEMGFGVLTVALTGLGYLA
jgi:hypothetical protein